MVPADGHVVNTERTSNFVVFQGALLHLSNLSSADVDQVLRRHLVEFDQVFV